MSVGRLDTNATGLLFFTNDGALANKLMHPSAQIEQEYAVRVLGEVTDEQLQALQKGVRLEHGTGKFDEIREAGGEGANRWYHVVLKAGGNREVRGLWEAVGHTVSRLIRVRYGAISLPRNLPRGSWRDATEEETDILMTAVGLRAGTKKSRPKLSLSKPRGNRRQH
ncbi:MAG: pseudouridine synthase [Bacillota bacterium]